jgi:hypothetical protein
MVESTSPIRGVLEPTVNAIHIHTTLNGEFLNLPEIKPLLGKAVEIIVREKTEMPPAAEPAAWVSPLAGSILRDDDPFGPAVPADEWEANH